MQRRLNAIFFLIATAVWETGCHKKQAAVPVPPAPIPTTTAPESTAQPQPMTPPPNITAPATTPVQPTIQPATPATQPPPTEETPKPPVRRPAKPGPGAPVNPANQPPQLGTLLTPEQQRQYNSAIDRSLGRAQAHLRAIGNRQLNAEQHDRVVQVESFIQQAQSLRKTNLMGAKSMADRAELLARDLLASLR